MQIESNPASEPSRTSTYSFYGLNRTRKGRKGEFEDILNMSTDEYPYASPTARAISQTLINAENIILALPPLVSDTDKITQFTGIANEKFYYNGKMVSEGYVLRSTWEWSAVIMGESYIINGVGPSGNVLFSYTPSTEKFAVMGGYMSELILYASTDSKGNYLIPLNKRYATISEYSVTLNDNTLLSGLDYYNKYLDGRSALGSTNIFSKQFQVGDEISISGLCSLSENVGQLFTYHISNDKITTQPHLSYDENNTTDAETVINPEEIDENCPVRAIVKSFSTTESTSGVYNHKIYLTLYNKNGQEIDFTDMGGSSSTNLPKYCMGVTLSLKKPSLNKICTHNGRIFGTHTSGKYIYGSSSDVLYDFSAASLNERLSARLSDFTPGTFTGICEYSNLLVVFKEQSITVIGGDNPENYYTDTINSLGCIDSRSIAVTPQGVIFLSYNGIYRYSGNVPTCISEKLNATYKSGVAGLDGQKYYLSATRADTGERELLVYDTRYGLWHKYSDNNMLGMFVFKGQLWEYTSDTLYCRCAENGYDHDWSMTSMRHYDYTLNRKAPETIWIKAELESGASFYVETSTDDGEFVKHIEYKKPGLFVVQCPCRIKMGNYYRYRISGRGKVVFYEIEICRSESGREYNVARQMEGEKINEATLLTYTLPEPSDFTY